LHGMLRLGLEIISMALKI